MASIITIDDLHSFPQLDNHIRQGGAIEVSAHGQMRLHSMTSPLADNASGPILLPGAFNPAHDGHWQLAAAAQRQLGRPAAFEISLANVDKPDLSWEEMLGRIRQFAGRAAVWLTRAPKFVHKAELFP